MVWLCFFYFLSITQEASCKCIPPYNVTNDDDEIFIKDQIADFDYARVTVYKTIDCCAQNYHKMIWSFKKSDTSNWRLYPWFHINANDDFQPALWNNNQTLEIKRVGFDNNGLYRCVAMTTNDTVIATHETQIEVFSCTDRVKYVAYGPKDKFSRVGENVTFTCIGDFGCTSDLGRDVTWYDENYNELNDVSLFPRYKITEMERARSTIVEVNFTINGVKESDFKKTFRCLVSSTYNSSRFQVHLNKQELTVQQTLPVDKFAAMGSVLLVFLLILTTLAALFFPKVKLIILSRIPYWHLPDIGDKKYHALILHDEGEDFKLARKMEKQLKTDGYKVKLSGSVKVGQDILQKIQDFALDSKSLIIIYPSEKPTNDFERILGAQTYFNIRLITVVKWDISRHVKVGALEDKALYKLVFPPQENCSFIQHFNFYCKLKLRMPRLKPTYRWTWSSHNTQENGTGGNGTLLNGNSPNVSPLDQQHFEYGPDV